MTGISLPAWRLYQFAILPWEILLPLFILLIALLPTATPTATPVASATFADPPAMVSAAVPAPSLPGLPASVVRFCDGRRLTSSLRLNARRRSKRSRELEAQRRQRKDRTNAEIDAIHAVYWSEASKHRSWKTGTAYARFSTRFQESIADQIREILEFALANQIRVPRHLIFFDMAVRGVKQRREGLDQVKATLRSRKATVLLLFSTNRLFRKTYMTLQFVETMHRELQARCIFVKTGIDTDNRDQWESMLHMHAMLDQFSVRVGVAHIQAAHQGMLDQRIVFGTLSYGYTGIPIEGKLTKQGKPRRTIAIDETTAAISDS